MAPPWLGTDTSTAYCRGLGRKWAAELCASEVAAQLPLLTPEELLTSLGDVAGGCLLGGLKSGSPSSSPGMFTPVDLRSALGHCQHSAFPKKYPRQYSVCPSESALSQVPRPFPTEALRCRSPVLAVTEAPLGTLFCVWWGSSSHLQPRRKTGVTELAQHAPHLHSGLGVWMGPHPAVHMRLTGLPGSADYCSACPSLALLSLELVGVYCFFLLCLDW